MCLEQVQKQYEIYCVTCMDIQSMKVNEEINITNTLKFK